MVKALTGKTYEIKPEHSHKVIKITKSNLHYTQVYYLTMSCCNFWQSAELGSSEKCYVITKGKN